MSQRGGGFRGKFKGRGRHSPYSRGGGSGGGGAGGGYQYRKVKNNGGGGKVKSETPIGAADHRADGTQFPANNQAPPGESSPLHAPGGAEIGPGPSPSHAYNPPGHTPTSARGAQGTGDGGGTMKEKEKKYSVKARLFVGNLPKESSQDMVRAMFEEFGEVKEVFVQREKSFGFVRMAYKSEAERAAMALDGKNIKGRDIKVRFAASNSSIKVSNLHPIVSNELLEEAFAQFGEVENAVVVTDERGKSLGHGIVDFSRKSYAQNAIRRCNEDHFFLTKTPMPVLVTEYIKDNDEEGQPERYIPKNNTYRIEREVPPRFAAPSSLEHAVATQWKLAYESEKRQRDELEQHLRQARNSLVNEMESIKEQHQTEMLRQELAHHQQEQLRLVQQLRMRQGALATPTASGMEPNGASGVAASLFPPPAGSTSAGPGDRPPDGMMEPPGYASAGQGQGVAGYPPGAVPLLPPPPLMGQSIL